MPKHSSCRGNDARARLWNGRSHLPQAWTVPARAGQFGFFTPPRIRPGAHPDAAHPATGLPRPQGNSRYAAVDVRTKKERCSLFSAKKPGERPPRAPTVSAACTRRRFRSTGSTPRVARAVPSPTGCLNPRARLCPTRGAALAGPRQPLTRPPPTSPRPCTAAPALLAACPGQAKSPTSSSSGTHATPQTSTGCRPPPAAAPGARARRRCRATGSGPWPRFGLGSVSMGAALAARSRGDTCSAAIQVRACIHRAFLHPLHRRWYRVESFDASNGKRLSQAVSVNADHVVAVRDNMVVGARGRARAPRRMARWRLAAWARLVWSVESHDAVPLQQHNHAPQALGLPRRGKHGPLHWHLGPRPWPRQLTCRTAGQRPI